jgi:hypothetical protein
VTGGDARGFDLARGQLTWLQSLDAVVAEGETVAGLGDVVRRITPRLLLAVLDA